MHLDLIQLQTLLDLAASSSDEVCGVLIGRSDPLQLRAIVPGRNVHPQPQRHFLLDAATLLRADQQARSTGDAIIGFYHSHPNGHATPSASDRADAWPDQIMLIVASGHGQHRYLCAWTVRDGVLVPEPIDLIR